jgi:TRAP-type uncharacterized transport system fused permease subunit
VPEPAPGGPQAEPLSRSVWGPVTCGLAALLTITAAAWSVGVPRYLSLGLYPQQFFAAALALALPVAFLRLPARRGAVRESVPWYDLAAAALGFAAAGFIAVRYPDLVNQIFFRPPQAYVPGVIVAVLGLEALRRATGWALPIIVVCFIVYALFGDGDHCHRLHLFRQPAGRNRWFQFLYRCCAGQHGAISRRLHEDRRGCVRFIRIDLRVGRS